MHDRIIWRAHIQCAMLYQRLIELMRAFWAARHRAVPQDMPIDSVQREDSETCCHIQIQAINRERWISSRVPGNAVVHCMLRFIRSEAVIDQLAAP